MNNEKRRLIEAIEILNTEKKEIKYSKEYRLGNSFLQTIEYLKKCVLRSIYAKIMLKRKAKIENKRLHTVKVIKEKEKKEDSVEDKKIVVYSCITGSYDDVLEPLYYNENVEYILYTNNNDINTKIWQKRKIPENIAKLNNNVLINRYIKMHPMELFNDYEYAIYIDGNIRSVSDLSSFVHYIDNKTGLAIHRHNARLCIYQEEKACELYKKGNKELLRRQIEKYRKEGFPKEYGLLECNVIVSDLNNAVSKKILDEWWIEFVQSESYRDQISLPYVLWKNNYKIEDIGNLGNNVKENLAIEIISHK